jgi:primosomal protein N' (replication factor Y) (superfamily II helicase)
MFYPKKGQRVLLILSRRGHFTITRCQNCKYVWECQNCAKNLKKGVNLVAYRTKYSVFELLCHQCQTYYKYPLECPKCQTKQIISENGGIDKLEEELIENYNYKVIRLDSFKNNQEFIENLKHSDDEQKIWLTTRLYDPLIDYSSFDFIVFIKAQNLLASTDYMVKEEVMNSLGLLFLEVQNSKTEVIFDTESLNDNLISEINEYLVNSENKLNVWNWYKNFLDKEIEMRKIFQLPPFTNLVLITSHEKSFEKAKNKLIASKKYLDEINIELKLELLIQSPYPARFLKRKNLFSYHLLIKYPRNYQKFNLLKNELRKIASSNNYQIRHNPRHIF